MYDNRALAAYSYDSGSIVCMSQNTIVERAGGQKIEFRKTVSVEAKDLSYMTLREILEVFGLPERLVRGDEDHVETTAVLDAVAKSMRASVGTIALKSEAW